MNRSKIFGRSMLLLLMVALSIGMLIPVSAQQIAPPEAVPTVASFAKSGPSAERLQFSSADFWVEAGEHDLDSIIISSLPDPNSGVLCMAETDLAVGDAISTAALDGISFYPNATPTNASTCFTFVPVFADGNTGSEVTVDLYLLTAENHAPIAENLTLSTYKNVSITQRFSATDPEGDLLTFRLVDKPARGAVTFPEDGSDQFVYAPYENKTGKDSFTYVAIDAVGNISSPATVSVKIDKASTTISYADMDGVSAHRAAIRLAEEGVLIGECMGGTYFFQPDALVTRDQFVALAMHTVGLEALEGVSRTGFADDASIPTWAKGYVSSALKAGLVQGTVSDSGVVFGAQRTITRAEASVLLNRMLQVTDATTQAMFSDLDSTPAWAYQAAVNLETVGVLQTNSSGALSLGSELTRADAAEMLCGALEVLDNRTSKTWFGW